MRRRLLQISAVLALLVFPAWGKFSIGGIARRTADEGGQGSKGASATSATGEEKDDDESFSTTTEPKGKGDPRVKAALDAMGLKYTFRDGDYVLSWTIEGNRSHIVRIQGSTTQLEDFEIRQVWAIAYKGPRLSRGELARLLQDNESKKIGAWGIQQDDSAKIDYILFTAKVPADMSAKDLRRVTIAVAETADEAEKRLDGGDDY